MPNERPLAAPMSCRGRSPRRGAQGAADYVLLDDLLVVPVEGRPGSQSISDTIKECAVFVGDISIVNSENPKPRPTPNPNVLFETGYAIAHKGWERMILVANTAYGAVEDLPFDIRGRRITRYELREGEEKADVRTRLVETLTEAIRLALKARS